jgi:ribonuclease P protein subunit POP4
VKVGPSIIQGEFIGLEARIVTSRHQALVGVSGKVVDESRNMFTIMDRNRRRWQIVKALSVFNFSLPDGTAIEVEGRLLNARPEDRIKKRLRRMW